VLRATLEYDGSRYRGWQVQVNVRTVQGELQRALREALEEITGEATDERQAPQVHGAGRTDAGVHALAQVASLHLPERAWAVDPRALRLALNERLPVDVNVLSLTEAPPSFHARHDAGLRIYRYRLATRRTAFGKPYVYWVKDRLDVAAMQRAAELFVGRHDFVSFCERPMEQESTLVEVSFVSVEVPVEVPELVLIRLGASHFLWKMVRRLAGTLVEVGAGRLAREDVAGLLARRTEGVARWTAPASGLFLEAVVYPGDPMPEPAHPLRPAF